VTAYPMTATRVPAQEAMRHQAAAVLQHTYRWLEAAVPGAPQLSSTIPPLVTAVQLYQAQQYAASLEQASAVIGSLRQARGAFPTLPPL
jgi:hypothetical protein